MDKIIMLWSINIGMLTEVGSGNKITDYSSISKCKMQIYLIIHYIQISTLCKHTNIIRISFGR